MLRNIFTQLWNRKRSNISLALELLCVFCLVWYMADYLFVYAYNLSLPNARHIERSWKVRLGVFDQGDPGYNAGNATPEALYADFQRLLQRLHEDPDIEAVGVCNSMSEPESGSYNGTDLFPADTTRSAGVQMLYVLPSEDFFRAFGYKASMKDFNWASGPQPIVLSRLAADMLFPHGQALGREVWTDPAHTLSMKVIGVIDNVKRFNYEQPEAVAYVPMKLAPDSDLTTQEMREGVVVVVRSKASVSDARFREHFRRDLAARLRIGNYYLQNLASYKSIRANTAQAFGITNQLRIRLFLMAFFLVNILLCVMGTFWYRIRLRRGEIGLRKAVGATRSAIRNSLLVEGLCLLAVVALVAMLIEANIVNAGLLSTLGEHISPVTYLPDHTVLRFLITNGLTLLLLAFVILLAIWLPARRAAAQPAVDALRDE
jgi:cell division protein FtsX